jgi:hypothetical protein
MQSGGAGALRRIAQPGRPMQQLEVTCVRRRPHVHRRRVMRRRDWHVHHHRRRVELQRAARYEVRWHGRLWRAVRVRWHGML